jgi:hypothetical protein
MEVGWLGIVISRKCGIYHRLDLIHKQQISTNQKFLHPLSFENAPHSQIREPVWRNVFAAALHGVSCAPV